MVNNDYLIDMSWCESGSYCDFLPIKGEYNLGFKSFLKQNKAVESYNNQLELAYYDLAPQVVTDICKIPYSYDPELLKNWTPSETVTSWGYVTEIASPPQDFPYEALQNLVEKIRQLTGKKFWDCHWDNVGYNKDRLLCVDTGNESFEGYSNAWGFEEPGPLCPYCEKFQCYCSTKIYEEECIT